MILKYVFLHMYRFRTILKVSTSTVHTAFERYFCIVSFDMYRRGRYSKYHYISFGTILKVSTPTIYTVSHDTFCIVRLHMYCSGRYKSIWFSTHIAIYILEQTVYEIFWFGYIPFCPIQKRICFSTRIEMKNVHKLFGLICKLRYVSKIRYFCIVQNGTCRNARYIKYRAKRYVSSGSML